jgi:hypothetical protein
VGKKFVSLANLLPISAAMQKETLSGALEESGEFTSGDTKPDMSKAVLYLFVDDFDRLTVQLPHFG